MYNDDENRIRVKFVLEPSHVVCAGNEIIDWTVKSTCFAADKVDIPYLVLDIVSNC